MIKKIVVILCLILLVGFSCTLIGKTKDNAADEVNAKQAKNEIKLDRKYTFSKDKLTSECLETDEQLCAVESAVKCTINPELEGCANKSLPKFIFMKDESLDRPTKISYKILNTKVLLNDNVEVYTESSCNGGWFGLCQGTVIYVLAHDELNFWYVKDIYAIE